MIFLFLSYFGWLVFFSRGLLQLKCFVSFVFSFLTCYVLCRLRTFFCLFEFFVNLLKGLLCPVAVYFDETLNVFSFLFLHCPSFVLWCSLSWAAWAMTSSCCIASVEEWVVFWGLSRKLILSNLLWVCTSSALRNLGVPLLILTKTLKWSSLWYKRFFGGFSELM